MRFLKKFCLLSIVCCLSSIFLNVSSAAEPKLTAQDYFERAALRYREIETWKKEKNWEGVYDKGPIYKKEIAEDLKTAEPLAKGDAVLLFDIKLLRWESLRDDDPDRAFELFDGVVAAAKNAVSVKEGLDAVKKAADSLRLLEDKNLSRRLYQVYADSVMKVDMTPDELLKSADGFLNENNIYLAKVLYEAYLGTFSEDKAAKAGRMIAIARKFAYPGDKEALGPVYAEGLYQKAADLAGDAAFDSAALYSRAFNLERMKDYAAASVVYKKVLAFFPDTPGKPEIYFRLGVFEAYGLKDSAAAQEYFTKIATEFPKDPIVLSALYQMGVLCQWQKEDDRAKGYYDAVVAEAGARQLDPQKTQIVVLAQERLRELGSAAEMAYGLRLFLEGMSGVAADGTGASLHVDLTAMPAKCGVDESVKFVVTTSNPQTGCMTPTYAYEWSGEVGAISNIPNSPEMVTSYPDEGLKVASVVVIGPAGPEGAGFDIVQIDDRR